MSRFLPPVVLIALLGICTLIGWQGSAGGDPKLIKVVSSLPRTGSAKAQTDTIVNGIKIALSEADYRAGDFHQGRGMRIDLILATAPIVQRSTFCVIDRNARKGTSPSDHAPVLVDLAQA